MKVLKIIEDKKLIDNILKNLNTINQLMKKIRVDKTYTISNKQVLACPNENYDAKKNNKDCGYHYANLNIDLLDLNDYDLFIEGDKYYSFFKELKKNVERIIIGEEKITFSTPIEKYNYIIPIKSKNIDEDKQKVLKYQDWMNKFYLSENNPIPIEFTLDEEIIDTLTQDYTIPKNINFNGYKLRMTKKLLPLISKDPNIKCKIYDLSIIGYDKYFFIEFTTIRKELTMINAYGCINY